MKLPRFKLRMLFVLIALSSIPIGWVGYQLNWIRQRRAFWERRLIADDALRLRINDFAQPDIPAPWSLRIFGEHGYSVIPAPKNSVEGVRRLFPEAIVVGPE